MENETSPPDAHDSTALKYLTVQDILWINLQVTKKVQHFNYARLEEATFYQYGYGGSRDLVLQAGRFLGGFLKLHPFDAGNEGTSFIGCAAFLLMNGKRLNVPDAEAASWIEKVKGGQVKAEEEVSSLIVDDENAHSHTKANVRDSVRELVDLYPKSLAAFRERGSQALAS